MRVHDRCVVLNAYSAIALQFRGHYISLELDLTGAHRSDRTSSNIAPRFKAAHLVHSSRLTSCSWPSARNLRSLIQVLMSPVADRRGSASIGALA